MCETEYENENKLILDACCKIINKTAATYSYKKSKLETRLSIDDYKERKRLKDDLAL